MKLITCIRAFFSISLFLVGALHGCVERDLAVKQGNNGIPKPIILEGLTGRVTASDSRPVQGAFIQPRSLDTPAMPIPEIAILTDKNGFYQWRLQPGNYEILVAAKGYKPASAKVTVKKGQETILNIELRRAQ